MGTREGFELISLFDQQAIIINIVVKDVLLKQCKPHP